METYNTFPSVPKSVKRTRKNLPIAFLLLFLLNACTRSIPSPTMTIRFPDTPTSFPSINEKTTPEMTSTETLSDPSGLSSEQPYVLDIGHFGEELLIFTIQFPSPIGINDYIVEINGKTYECILQDEMNDLLYCFGEFIVSNSTYVIIEVRNAKGERFELVLDLSAFQQGEPE